MLLPGEIVNLKWNIIFSLQVLLSMLISGGLYLYQNTLQLTIIQFQFLRMLRMFIVYVIPVYFFLKWDNRSILQAGLERPHAVPNLSVFGGISLYLFAAIIFIEKQIFFRTWMYQDVLTLTLNIVMVGIMAAITDFWTRGFILLTLADKYSSLVGIIVQNIIWFTIHYYEIELLNRYISIWGSIALTLFLGIGGDIIAIKSRSIYGLMLGHFFLNFFPMIAAIA